MLYRYGYSKHIAAHQRYSQGHKVHIGQKVTFETGNGTLRGEIVGSFEINGAIFYEVRDQFRDTRALRGHELTVF